ncbi:hypothetical protein [Ferruginibacter sp.]|nr:hypothetical protein [Ferruginibacter sp.]
MKTRKITRSATLLLILYCNVLNAQNVGIGTVIPSRPLTIKTDGIGVSQESSSDGAKIGFYTSGTNAYLQTHNTADLKFATNDSSFSMILKRGTGFLGIGATNPSTRLDVNGNIKADTIKPNAIKFTNNAADGKVLTSDASGNANWQTLAAAPYSILERFQLEFKNTQAPNDGVINTYYNYGTATFYHSNSSDDLFDITINKPGLYHFDVNCSMTITGGAGGEPVDLYIHHTYAAKTICVSHSNSLPTPYGWSTASIDKSFELYVPVATSYRFFFYKQNIAPWNYQAEVRVTGHLIAE